MIVVEFLGYTITVLSIVRTSSFVFNFVRAYFLLILLDISQSVYPRYILVHIGIFTPIKTLR